MYQKGAIRLPIWSPILIASRPRCTVTPTESATFAVMNPWIAHCPPLDGTNNATTVADSAAKKGNVYCEEIDAINPAKRSPTVVN
jgi:hypothetical protein